MNPLAKIVNESLGKVKHTNILTWSVYHGVITSNDGNGSANNEV